MMRKRIRRLESRIDLYRDELHGLWDKHNRLLGYLHLVDEVIPQKKIIRESIQIKENDMEPTLHIVHEPMVVVPGDDVLYGMSREELSQFKESLVLGHRVLIHTIEKMEERFVEINDDEYKPFK